MYVCINYYKYSACTFLFIRNRILVIFFIFGETGKKMVRKNIIRDIEFYMGDSMQTDHNETGRYLNFFQEKNSMHLHVV